MAHLKTRIIGAESKQDGAVAIAQWFHLPLLFCGPGSTPRQNNYTFRFVIELSCEKDENQQKRPGFAIFYQKLTRFLEYKRFRFVTTGIPTF